MFRLASCELTNRNVLLVEDDECTADVLAASLKADDGNVVGFASTLPQAVQMSKTLAVDIVLLHIRYVREYPDPISEIFSPSGIEVEFLACFDDWFDFALPDDGDTMRFG